ncbi:MAG: Uma2 family endonuclease [Oscillospiraceae bacterium]|jgi:Uma2 family endonuclease|nr:Uma2 family endonuclease [Oscillospiraceae bacterium]
MTRERAREVSKDDYHELKVEFMHGRKEYMAPASLEHTDSDFGLQTIFRSFIRLKKLPHRVCSDALCVYYDDKHYVTPDIAIVADPSMITKNKIQIPPDLVIEILSPKTVKRDNFAKKDIYGKFGVPEYWTVDTNDKSVIVYKNTGNNLEYDNMYQLPPRDFDPDVDDLDEDDFITSFHTPLFGDELTINLEDVFFEW